jgi:CxxC motif-containing protein (DUF1111 family)
MLCVYRGMGQLQHNSSDDMRAHDDDDDRAHDTTIIEGKVETVRDRALEGPISLGRNVTIKNGLRASRCRG